MDKSQTKYFKWAAGILAVIAFAMMFLPQICLRGGSTMGVEALFDSRSPIKHSGATWAFVGYIFMIVGGIIVTVFSFVLRKPENRIENFVYTVIGDVLVLAGAVLVFCTYAIYGAVNVISTNTITGIGCGPIIGGILGVLSVVAGGIGGFLDLKDR